MQHTLPDSLIYIESENKIITLNENPTLLFTGSPNGGYTKTTDISWSEKTGILFKIIDPLYNGETYSTDIKWLLTSTPQ